MKILGIIPARYASSRFPGKPLATLHGRPMIEVVYKRALQAQYLDGVVVATDDDRIFDAVRKFGGEAVMTSPDHPSGTDRAAEVTKNTEAEMVVNIQGDEPLIRPDQIDALIDALRRDQGCDMATLMTPITSREEFESPDVVKVICDQDGYAIYFSRSPVPHGVDPVNPETSSAFSGPYKHIGIYAYRREFLFWLTDTEPTPLERTEKLEQLRVLEHGHKIRAILTPHDTVSVDRPEDLEKVARMLHPAE
ncbi:3-deoxy-manno-octulosonate cytidylyltransferase [Acidobacteriota bacterium]